jgi:hypothetical protein
VYSTETQWFAFTTSKEHPTGEDIDRIIKELEQYRDEDEVAKSRQHEEMWVNGRPPSLRKVGNQTKAWGGNSAPMVVVDSSRRQREENRTTGLKKQSKDEPSSAPTEEP